MLCHPSRRDVLYNLGLGLGGLAFNALLQAEPARSSPLAARQPHHRPRAKACIFLFMEGGPSHIDTFDPKPKLASLHMKEFTRQDKFASAMASGKRYYVQSPFAFRKAGRAGLDFCEHFVELPKCADDLCVYRGLQAESIDHPTACFHMNTGNRFGGDPAMGSWIAYGLGTPNQNLPAFVVLPEAAYPQGGAANWSNGFLPAYFQGTPLRAAGAPILDLHPPQGVTRETQRHNLDLLADLNQREQARRPLDDAAARMAAYELAFRMQVEVPETLAIDQEDARTQEMYGIGQELTDSFGRRCLLARRLVERGVRFVQLYAAGWDSHDYIANAHQKRIQAIDRPFAALLRDLKQRGLLDETLVVWAGEFGRSPDNGIRGGGTKVGRDHNAKAMSVLLAGGGIRPGLVGATDDIGDRATDCVHPLKDLHATLLHQLGLADSQLTYFHEGRFKQISQTGDAKVIRELVG